MGFPTPLSPIKGMRAGPFPPRPGRRLLRYLATALLLLACFFILSNDHGRTSPFARRPLFSTGTQTPLSSTLDDDNKNGDTSPPRHPIDVLVRVAEKDFQDMLSRQSQTLSQAAAAYRARRGRHPPPGFDAWYTFAKERNAVIIEDFWDQIYHDLEPFWAVPAALIRKQAWDFEMTIQVRDHNASTTSDWFWTRIWLDMFKTVEHLLPDMDIALNPMDEPRLVVPWEDMSQYVSDALKTRRMLDPRRVVGDFQKLPPFKESDRKAKKPKMEWEDTKPFWKIVRRGCSPTSLARQADVQTNFNVTPVVSNNLARPHMFRGFVANYTLSTQLCHQPDLQGLNGIFVNPLSVAATKDLLPVFGGSKLAINNEILLPAPMYWRADERFTGGDEHGVPWGRKKDRVVWRGVATGGRNTEWNWKAFQRHRFVAMNNGTKLARTEDWTELPANFALPSSSYGLKAQEAGRLGPWVDSWADVSFVDLMCYPKRWREDDPNHMGSPYETCNYTSPHFDIKDTLSMGGQFDFKYLPDIDGNSFSGRYLGFLRSTSLPIKATVWREWHDSRLVAWKHFVPMDNRYSDWYGIMEYFLGWDGADPVPGHDAVAERIANAGKLWAERVLRKEDMQIYVLRLLLEYARVTDERREGMGWVEDLVSKDA